MIMHQSSLLLVARPQVSLPARLVDRLVPRRQQLRLQMPRDVLVVVALLQDGGQPGDDLGVLRGEVDLLGRVGQNLSPANTPPAQSPSTATEQRCREMRRLRQDYKTREGSSDWGVGGCLRRTS